MAELAPEAATLISFFSQNFSLNFSPHFVATETLVEFFIEVSLLGEALYKSMAPIFLSESDRLQSVGL